MKTKLYYYLKLTIFIELDQNNHNLYFVLKIDFLSLTYNQR